MKLQKQIWKRSRARRHAVFLDRDGTLIRHRYVVTKESHMRPLPGVTAGLKKLQHLGYFLIVVTNQPGIEKGDVSVEVTKEMQDVLRKTFQKKGIELNAVYFCPHR